METISIIDQIDENANYKNIRELNIFGKDFDGEPLEVNFKDLLEFPYLEKLNIEYCMISNEEIEILSQLKELEELSFYSCEFEKSRLKNFSELNLKSLTIRNSYDFPLKIINNKTYQKLVLSHIKLKDISIAVNELYLYNMDIDYPTLKNWIINKLVITEDEYEKNRFFYEECPYKVIVMDKMNEHEIKKVGIENE